MKIKNTKFTTNAALTVVLLFGITLLLSFNGLAQTTVFTDNYNRATLSPGGTPSMTYNTVNTGTGSSATSGSSFLQTLNGGTAGRSYVRGPLSTYSSPFTPTLSSNTGIVTWTFNTRTTRTSTLSGLDAGNYGIAVVLAADNTDFLAGAGYAVVYGGSGNREYRLVHFTGGLDLNSNVTTITSSGANDFSNASNYVSIRVTYNPVNSEWKLFLRDDGASAWTDPSSGVTSQKGSTTVNTTYTSTSLSQFGFLWNYSTGASQNAQYDNFKVTVDNTPFLNVSPASLAFGSQAVSTNSLSSSFDLYGVNLTGFTSTINVTAPTHFQVSNDNSTWGSSTTITYTSATLSATPVYVRFSPTTTGAKSGNVTFTGGGSVATYPVVALSGTCPAAANTKLWAGGASGNWNTAGSWSPSGVPAAGDVVTFNSPSTIAVAVNVGPATLSSITISNSSAVTFTSSGRGRTITLSNLGTALNVESGSSMILKGSSGSGTRSMDLAFSGSGNAVEIAGTLTVTDVLEGSNVDFTNSITTIKGTLKNDGSTGGTTGTITSTASNLSIAANGTYQHALDGGTIPTATWDVASTCNVTGWGGTTTAPGGIPQDLGNFTWNSSSQTAALSLGGALNVVNGNFTVTSSGSGSLSLGGTGVGNLTIGGNYSQPGGSFIGSSSAARTINVTGNFSISGGTFNLSSSGTAGNAVVLTIDGNYTHSAGTITESGSTTGSGITFGGTSTQTFSSGGTLSNTVNFIISSGAIVDFGTAVISNGSNGTFNLNSGGKIITSNNAGLTTSGATGSVQLTGSRTYNSGASYEFKGTNTGTFTLSTPNTITGTLTFNRAAGITIDQNFTASTLALTSGAVTTNALAITIPSGGTFTGGSTTAYVSGILKRVFPSATTLVYPIGKGGNYRPVTFQYTALTGTSTLTLEQFESTLTGTAPLNTNIGTGRFWTASQSGGSAFTYKISLDSTGFIRTGPVVMIKKESGTLTSNAATSAGVFYTNTSGFTTLTTSTDFALGSTCTVSSNAGADQTSAATCGLTSVSLAANTPTFGTGQWSIISGSGGSFSGGSGNPSTSSIINPTFNGTAGVTYTLRWTITNGNCSSTDDMLVTFNQNPSAAAGADQTGASTCGLTSVTLAATTPTVGTGQWSIVSGSGGSFTGGSGNPSNSSIINPIFTGTAGTTYTLRWTVSNSPCTSAQDDMVVTFNENPTTSNAGPDQTNALTCGLTSVTLAANSPTIGTGQWSIVSGSGGSFSGGAGNPTNSDSPGASFTGVAGNSYTLRWTISNSPCTASTDDVDVTFNVDPTVANAGADQTNAATCGLTTVTLAANTPTAGTGTWTILSGVGGSFVNTNNPTTDFSGVAGSTYSLQWEISTICNTSTDNVTITFNENPSTSDAGPDQTGIATCSLTSVTLASNAPTIGTGLWTIESGVGGSLSNASSETSTFTGVPGTAYTLRWTISNAPCSDSFDEVLITFNEDPTTSNAGTNQNVCLGSSATLAANSPTVGTGTWSIISGPSSNLSQFSNINDPTAVFTEDGGLGVYTLQWNITNAPCNPSASTVNVSVISGPWIGSVSDDWSDPANWCGGVPTATTDVTISNGATFYPVIYSGARVAQSISIESAASLTIKGGSLTGGDIANDGLLTVDTLGTLTMISNQVSGTGDVVIDGTFETSKAAGFSGTASTAIMNTINSISLGNTSTIDYTSSGPQNITEANYANLSNSGNGNRTLANSGTIGISGVFSQGTGDYDVTGSLVEFNGTSAQTIPALLPDSKYNSLEINNASGVSMVADLNLIESLFLTNGAFTTTGFNFTLLSSATSTANIAEITGGSIVGDVTMQRFVPGGAAGWATIGMPVGGRTLADWNDDIITSGFNGSSTGSGTFVNIYTYDETVGGNSDAAAAYIPATDITNTVDPKDGYFVFIADNATTVADKLLDVSGPPLTGSQVMNISYTNNVSVDEDGWNLINNPYCSDIDWTAGTWTKTNMDDAIYIYDAENNQYVGYVDGVSHNGGNEIIASSQAFLVHANAVGAALVAEESVKTLGSTDFYKTPVNKAAVGLMRMQLDGLNGMYHDETIFRTRTGASSNFDSQYDAYKLYSFDAAAPNISSMVNGIQYVVNSVNDLSTNLDLPVKVNVTTAGTYTINFVGLDNFRSQVNCFTFEDKLTNTTIDLALDSSYSFTSGIDTVGSYCRFVLHFGVEAIIPVITPSATSVSLPGNTAVSFNNTTTGANYYVWNFGDGSAVDSSLSPVHTFATVGVYTVSLTAINDAGCSETTSVQITVDDVTSIANQVANEPVISVVKDGQGLQLNYSLKGATKVQINMYSALGEKVIDTKLVSLQDKGRYLIETPLLAKGIYTVELLYNNRKLYKKIEN